MDGASTEDAARRRELCDFLKYARSRIAPTRAGVSTNGRRRLPGLRRDEVAALCGVSAAWYTWFETGRPSVRASPRLIAAVARSLQLETQETTYLFSLAIPEMPRLPAPKLNHFESTLQTLSSTLQQNLSAGRAALRTCDFFPIGVYCTTPGGAILYANDALARLLRHSSRSSYVRLDVTRDLYEKPHERSVWQQKIEQAGQLRNVATRERCADGGLIDVLDTAVAVRPGGATACYVGFWKSDSDYSNCSH